MKLQGKLLPSVVIAAVALLLLVGCGSGGGAYGSGSRSTPTSAAVGAGGGPSTGDSVSIQDFAFTPQTLSVKVGTKVTWTNNDSALHTVTSTDSMSTNASTTGAFDSGQLSQGDTFSFTFTNAGTYFYECTIHKSMAPMHAKIVVK